MRFASFETTLTSKKEHFEINGSYNKKSSHFLCIFSLKCQISLRLNLRNDMTWKALFNLPKSTFFFLELIPGSAQNPILCTRFVTIRFFSVKLISRKKSCPMYDLPMGSSWPNTIDHGTKASSERLGQKGIKNRVDAGITVGKQ